MAHNFVILQRIKTGPAPLKYASESAYFAYEFVALTYREHYEPKTLHVSIVKTDSRHSTRTHEIIRDVTHVHVN